MLPHEPSRNSSKISLEAHVEKLRSCCEATSRFQGGSTYYHEELGIFDRYMREAGCYLPAAPIEMNRPPDDEGNEHQVWFLKDRSSFLKATWPGFYGMQVIHRPHEEPKASPIDYLERWHLHNIIFGDAVRFLGALNTSQGLRLLIEQPAIQGVPATDEEIDRFFRDSGWKRFAVREDIAYFDPELNVVISDTHRGNLVKMPDGVLAPIDLRVQRIEGSLLDSVIQLTS